MDSLITAAARALAAGDPLGALKRVALRDDAPALALRGVAMAQLGDFPRAKALLRDAVRAFAPDETVARARCAVAQAEVALASRDLAWPMKALDAAAATLEAHGDQANAAHARYLEIRRLVLIGRFDEAERRMAAQAPDALPDSLQAIHALTEAGVAMRRERAGAAKAALDRAELSARRAGILLLAAEVETARQALAAPAARLIERGVEQSLRLVEVEGLSVSDALVVDARRNLLRVGDGEVSLARRPVLFALARALAEAWPGDASREGLAARAFGARRIDETHRARLRVEIGRLRAMARGVAGVVATPRGFALAPERVARVVVLAPPADERHAAVLVLLSDGEAWSSSALAIALDASQRTVQRALDALAAEQKVRPAGQGRARRWMLPPPPGITTTLLLPTGLAGP